MAPRTRGSRHRVVPSSYGGVEQRWVLLYSAPRQVRVQRTMDTQLRKPSEQEGQAFKHLCHTPLACAADAQQALATFVQGLQATFVAQPTVRPTPRYAKRGRPGQGTP